MRGSLYRGALQSLPRWAGRRPQCGGFYTALGSGDPMPVISRQMAYATGGFCVGSSKIRDLERYFPAGGSDYYQVLFVHVDLLRVKILVVKSYRTAYLHLFGWVGPGDDNSTPVDLVEVLAVCLYDIGFIYPLHLDVGPGEIPGCRRRRWMLSALFCLANWLPCNSKITGCPHADPSVIRAPLSAAFSGLIRTYQ